MNCHRYLDSKYWRDLAENEIEESLAYQWITEPARNVIIFIGDGMSPDTITASRIFKSGEHSYLAWEKFPHMGLLKVIFKFYVHSKLQFARSLKQMLWNVENNSRSDVIIDFN